jgi:hypothetical protein
MILKMLNNCIKFKHINVNCKIIYYHLLINQDIHKNYYNVYYLIGQIYNPDNLICHFNNNNN